MESKHGDGEDDDEEWEDASDGEDDEGSDSEHDSRGDEKKDTGKEKPTKSKDNSHTSPTPRSRRTSAGSPKEQRPPRPKIHIPPPSAVQESPEGGKPLSPFYPLDGHQPVSDWGEEMEMLSPRSSMEGESPLKPPSVEASPPQKKEQELEEETESQAAGSGELAEPQKEEDTGRIWPSCLFLFVLCSTFFAFHLISSLLSLFLLRSPSLPPHLLPSTLFTLSSPNLHSTPPSRSSHAQP